ncbi:MAG TPA: XRE family transcriptional regulator [Trueperaceae bacterium]|nr:XRE family transcriptional regulator [Trueperaceae bacterium]
MSKCADEQMITLSSGNVFADLGLPEPEERLAKARLASRIQDAIEAHGWAPEQVPEALSLSEAEVSRLAAGRLKAFSVERLTGLLKVVEAA